MKPSISNLNQEHCSVSLALIIEEKEEKARHDPRYHSDMENWIANSPNAVHDLFVMLLTDFGMKGVKFHQR